MKDTTVIAPEVLAELIQSQYTDMLEAAKTVGAAKAEWSPLGKGRTVLSQLQECVLRAERMLAMLNGTEFAAPTSEEELSRYGSFDLAVSACATAADALAEKIRTMSLEELARVVQTPFGGYPLMRLMVSTYWNASYHEGQITYIGILAGE